MRHFSTLVRGHIGKFAMADADLDAELALFEKEIEDVANAVDVNADPNLTVRTPAGDARPVQARAGQEAGGDPCVSPALDSKEVRTDDNTKGKHLRASDRDLKEAGPSTTSAAAVVLASGDAVVAQQPEWQLALQERDAQRMRAKDSRFSHRRPQGSANGAGSAGGAGVSSAAEGHAFANSGRTGSAGPEQGAGAEAATRAPMDGGAVAQIGAWVWDGWQWVWDERAPSAGQPIWQAAGTAAGPQGEPQSSEATHEAGEGAGRARERRQSKKHVRAAAGNVWVDNTLDEWPEDDFRVFVGDLAPDATDDELREAFSKYPSFNMARVIVDKRTGEGKGYGFVSFAKGEDMVSCLKEMNGKYVGSRPVSLKKSDWQKRDLTSDRRRDLKVFKKTGLVKRRKRF